MNIALITARGGSKSIKNKNLYPIEGIPLIGYPINAAINAEYIDKIFVSTDSQSIKKYCVEHNCEIIDRPEDLSGDDVNHGDVIKHAIELVDNLEENLENVVVLLGNTVMIDGNLIDESLKILNDNKKADSVMSVWEAADDHPSRSLEIIDGKISVHGNLNRNVSTARQSYNSVYYYDQGVWTLRKECVQSNDGPNPWWWMGKNCIPIIRPWITGRDVQAAIDIEFAKHWVQNKTYLENL